MGAGLGGRVCRVDEAVSSREILNPKPLNP